MGKRVHVCIRVRARDREDHTDVSKLVFKKGTGKGICLTNRIIPEMQTKDLCNCICLTNRIMQGMMAKVKVSV